MLNESQIRLLQTAQNRGFSESLPWLAERKGQAWVNCTLKSLLGLGAVSGSQKKGYSLTVIGESLLEAAKSREPLQYRDRPEPRVHFVGEEKRRRPTQHDPVIPRPKNRRLTVREAETKMLTDLDARDKFRMLIDAAEGCWLWKGSIGTGGYGVVFAHGQQMKAHRVSKIIFEAEMPGDRLVCHHCDNPTCVNPEHLFFGSAQDNTHDMISKGRARGLGLKFPQQLAKVGREWREKQLADPELNFRLRKLGTIRA